MGDEHAGFVERCRSMSGCWSEEDSLLVIGVSLRKPAIHPDDRRASVQQPHNLWWDENCQRTDAAGNTRATPASVCRAALYEHLRSTHGLLRHVCECHHEGPGSHFCG